MGVVKNIIPAIASTNALVSAHCVTEAIKSLSGCNFHLDNYLQYMGQTGLSTQTFVFERSSNCVVCSKIKRAIQVSSSLTLREFLKVILEEFRLQGPSIDSDKGPVYISAPPTIEAHHSHKLDLTLKQLTEQGVLSNDSEYTIVDKAIPSAITLVIKYTD
jgi:ubiquitin-activating enzyme E1 C